MSEEQKKTDDEGKTIPRPEGYTIVKYSMGWVFVIVYVGVLVCPFLGVFIKVFRNHDDYVFLIVYIGIALLFWTIGRKVTEVKVNLKITDEGLEQTRLSGSRIYPKHRLIKWEKMKNYYLNGRTRDQDFMIRIEDDTNFRISIPLFTLFEKQKDNLKTFVAFQNDFWDIAPEHDVHRAFFG